MIVCQDEIILTMNTQQEINSFIEHNFEELLTNSQREAMISLIEDIGLEKFSNSKIPDLIYKQDFNKIISHLMYFIYKGRVISIDMLKRRQEEQILFLEGIHGN